MEFEVEVTGLKEIQARLEALPNIILNKCIARSLHAAGSVMSLEMQERCPVMENEEDTGSNALAPGALQADIKARVSVQTNNGYAVCTIGPSKKTAYVAGFIEYGHEIYRGKKKSRSRKNLGSVPKKPFLRPAYDAKIDQVGQVYRDSLTEQLNALEAV
jgi:HK97 gp10 family phage protein